MSRPLLLFAAAALANWIPGRTATGLKQAHITHVHGSGAKIAAVLKANGWPHELTELLAVWPGPLDDIEVCSSQVSDFIWHGKQ